MGNKPERITEIAEPEEPGTAECSEHEHEHDIEPFLPHAEPPDAEPVISSKAVWFVGFFVYALSQTYPPAILLLTLLLAKLLPYMYRANDDAVARRKTWNEWEKSDRCPKIFKQTPPDFDIFERYWVNSRGMCIFTTMTVPKNGNFKAIVCSCHGYSETATYMKRLEHRRLARAGFACISLEYEGHGRSDGTLALVTDWDRVVEDVVSFFSETLKNEVKFQGKPAFLMGESMGGAVAFCTYQKIPDFFKGVVFYAPMLKIAEEMKPPQFVTDFLMSIIGKPGSHSLLGTLPLSPSADVISKVFKSKEKRWFALLNPLGYRRKPRLSTSREMLYVTGNIEKSMDTFDGPFLVVHGRADMVTDHKLPLRFRLQHYLLFRNVAQYASWRAKRK